MYEYHVIKYKSADFRNGIIKTKSNGVNDQVFCQTNFKGKVSISFGG